MVLDYSKWNNLQVSDDEDVDRALPRVIKVNNNEGVVLDKNGYNFKENINKLWYKRINNGNVIKYSHLYSQTRYELIGLIKINEDLNKIDIKFNEQSIEIYNDKQLILSKDFYSKIKIDENYWNWELIKLEIDWDSLYEFSKNVKNNPNTPLYFNNTKIQKFIEINLHKLNEIADCTLWWPKFFKLSLRFPEISCGFHLRSSTIIQTHLEGLKDKYEIKLGETSLYQATPDGQSITPRAVEQPQEVNEEEDGTPQYKGFKHQIPDNTKKINRITIYNHVIPEISELAGDGHTISNANGGVFVYFPMSGGNPELNKPLLICLSQEGQAGDNTKNRWYKRQPGLTWTNAATGKEYDSINPGSDGTISTELVKKLGEIKEAPELANDKGYPSRCNIKWTTRS